MRMRPVGTVWAPRRRSPLPALVGLLVGLLLVVGIAIVVNRLGKDFFDCSPPTRQEQVVQEAFVRSRIVDAQDLEWTFADCDDNGTGWLSFITALAPAEAQDAFLADAVCSRYREPGEGENNVRCNFGDTQIFIYIRAASSGGTAAELAVV